MIMERLIRSDELPEDVRALERTLGASCVILSTLSTLSNPGLDANGMFDCVPVERLVIDEASQINAFEYMVRAACLWSFPPSYLIHVACVREVQVIEEDLLLRGPLST